jgi:hypothetical protein
MLPMLPAANANTVVEIPPTVSAEEAAHLAVVADLRPK